MASPSTAILPVALPVSDSTVTAGIRVTVGMACAVGDATGVFVGLILKAGAVGVGLAGTAVGLLASSEPPPPHAAITIPMTARVAINFQGLSFLHSKSITSEISFVQFNAIASSETTSLQIGRSFQQSMRPAGLTLRREGPRPAYSPFSIASVSHYNGVLSGRRS